MKNSVESRIVETQIVETLGVDTIPENQRTAKPSSIVPIFLGSNMALSLLPHLMRTHLLQAMSQVHLHGY